MIVGAFSESYEKGIYICTKISLDLYHFILQNVIYSTNLWLFEQ